MSISNYSINIHLGWKQLIHNFKTFNKILCSLRLKLKAVKKRSKYTYNYEHIEFPRRGKIMTQVVKNTVVDLIRIVRT